MYQNKVRRVSRKSQLNHAAGVNAIQLAKKKNDPLYKKMSRYRKKYLEAKERLSQKYSRSGLARARRNN